MANTPTSTAAPSAASVATTPTNQTPQTQTPVQGAPANAPKTYKIKVDGVEESVSEADLIALAQQGKSSGKRFQEASVAKKQAEEIVNYLKNNPKEAFKKLGIDVRKFSEDTLMEMLNQEKMSPEQRKAAENEDKLRKYEAADKAAKEKAQKDQMAALEREHMQNYDQMFIKALSESGLPKTAYTVKRMAELTLVNVKKGLNLDPSQLAKIVRQDYESEIKALYSQADGDALMDLLGKDAVKKLSKAQLSKYKAKATNTTSAPRYTNESKEPSSDPVSNWKAMKKKTRSLI